METKEQALNALKTLKPHGKATEVIKEFKPEWLYGDQSFALKAIAIAPEVFPYFQITSRSFLEQAIALYPWVADYVAKEFQATIDECIEYLEISDLTDKYPDDENWKRCFFETVGHIRYVVNKSPYIKSGLCEHLIQKALLDWFANHGFHFDRTQFIREACDLLEFYCFLPLACKAAQDDEALVEDMIRRSDGIAFAFLPEKYLHNKEYIKGWLPFFPGAFQFLDDNQRNDEDLVYSATAYAGLPFAYADDRIRYNKKVVLKIIEESYNPDIYPFLPAVLKRDKDIALAAIEIDPFFFDHLDESLQKNEDIIKAFEARKAKNLSRYKVLVDPVPQPVFKPVR